MTENRESARPRDDGTANETDRPTYEKPTVESHRPLDVVSQSGYGSYIPPEEEPTGATGEGV